jgi:hypothetical protein
MTLLLDKQKLNNTIVTGNGKFLLYASQELPNNNGHQTIEARVNYEATAPDVTLGGCLFSLTTVIETSDETGNWYPVHNQYNAHRGQNDDVTHFVKLDPDIFNLDEGVSTAVALGDVVISLESRKQGKLPSSYRFAIYLIENKYGKLHPTLDTPLDFIEATVTLTYDTY